MTLKVLYNDVFKKKMEQSSNYLCFAHVLPNFFKPNSLVNPTKRVGLVQRGRHHHLIKNKLVLSMI